MVLLVSESNQPEAFLDHHTATAMFVLYDVYLFILFLNGVYIFMPDVTGHTP